MNDASNGGGIVIGTFATSSSDGIAIGLSAVINTSTEDGIAIGRASTIAGGVIRGVAIGREATVSADNAFAIGNYVVANNPDTIIFGTNTSGNKQKVGIGTTNPSALLDVVAVNNGPYAFSIRNNTHSSNTANGFKVYQENDGRLIHFLDTSRYMTVSVGGSVSFASDNYISTDTQLIAQAFATGAASYAFYAKGISNNGLTVDGDGNVGINKFTASAKLHIKGVDATSSNYSLKIEDSTTASLFSIRNDGFATLLDMNIGRGASLLSANTALGVNVLSAVTTGGNYNTGIGFQALASITTGQSNTAIGYYAGNKITTTNGNVAIGDASFSNNYGSSNIAIGSSAMVGIGVTSTGTSNIGIGYASLSGITSGNYNIGIGHVALQSITTGNNNTSIGYASGNKNTIGYENTSFGTNSMVYNTSGNYNVAVGSQALQGVLGSSTGSVNTAVGVLSFAGNTTGDYNVGLGYRAGYTNSTGTHNIAIGGNASLYTNNGNYNIAIGSSAGVLNDGSNNIFIGNQTGSFRTTDSNRLIIDNYPTGRTNAGQDLTQSIIVGNFAATPDLQYLRFNANVGLGIDATAKLHVAGIDATSGNYALKIEDSASGNLLQLRNDGYFQIGGFSGNYIYFDPTPASAWYEIRISDGVDTSQFILSPTQINMSNAAGQILITSGQIELYGSTRLLLSNTVVNAQALPVGNTGLATGDLYVDTAANILANGDYVVGRKA